MLIANTPKERRLQVADAPLFPIFLPLFPEFPISKRHQPCHGVGLAHFLPSPKGGGGIKKQQLLANPLGRWAPPPRASPVASSSLTSLCEELAESRARTTAQGSARGSRSQRTRATWEPSQSAPSGRRESCKPRPPPCPQRATPGCWDSARPPGIRSEGTQRLGEQQGRWAKLAPSSEWRRLGWGSVTLAPGSSECCLYQWVCAQVPAWAAGNGFGDVNK